MGFTPNIVTLDLEWCTDLVEIHVPVGCSKRLVHLDLGFCLSLKKISFIKELESLEFFNLNGLVGISLELRSINVNLDDGLVGMELRLQDLHESLAIASNEVRMIGIKGMGGVGKTTLARVAFDRLSIHFEAKCFVENVREVSKASLSGLLSLQRKILLDLLNYEGDNIRSVYEGTKMMKTKLRGKKVLVVLDDVDHKDQLDGLAGDLNWFKPGSRIFITTRDEQVLLAHRVIWIHDVDLLSSEEAIGLFSRHAFGKDIPDQEYEKQSLEVVRYVAGLPLTIKVLGSFLCGKDKHEWIDALARLRTIPLKETLEKLELSYETLEDDYKEIFLDIACILKGQLEADAIAILESCGFHARIGLRVLEQRSLTTYNFDNGLIFLSMHDHIEEMGKNIVRRLHPDEPNKHSRMWIKEEIEDVLENDLGTEVTKCMMLTLSPEIKLKGFGNMKKLRCLLVNWKDFDEEVSLTDNDYNDCVQINEVSQYFPNSLRYLWWSCYPHRCLPETFQANNLVTLNMEHSNIEEFPTGGKVMKKLKYLSLSFAKSLWFLNLECTPNLVELDLWGCEMLESFSFIKELQALQLLWLGECQLTEFPDIIPSHSNSNLQQLNLVGNDIENLPSSIGNLHKLVYLYLWDCTKLKELPGSICRLQNLRELDLGNCGIVELPNDIGQMECLETLNLEHSKVKFLPDSICKLEHLTELILAGCEISHLPEDFGQIESLIILNLRLSKIRDLPSSFCKLKNLGQLYLSKCYNLKKLPENLGCLKWLEKLDLTHTPISHLPDSISSLEDLIIIGYEKRIEPDAHLSQGQQHITRAPKRRNIDNEATTCDAVINESQPLDSNDQTVDQASITGHAGAKRSNRLRKIPQKWNDFVLGSTSARK